MTALPVVSDEPTLLRIEEAAERLRVGRSTVYDLIRTRRLRSVKIGRRRLIPTDAIAEAIEALSEETTW